MKVRIDIWWKYRRFNGCLLLIKRKDVEVTVFDHGLRASNQGGSRDYLRWFSKRRNKAW